jgi:propanol-preferring alcohol dehydrogenase
LTRDDGVEFMQVAPSVPVEIEVTVYSLEAANEALADLRSGNAVGALVLAIDAYD